MAKIDDSVKKKVPELRFKGFTDDWEERKLGDTETHFTDGNYGESYPSAKDMSDKANGIPFLRGSDFSNGYLDSSNANYIKPEKHAELTSGHIKQDDIVLAVRGSLGTLGYATKENEGWNINSQLAILRTNKSEISGMFLIQYLLGSKGQKEIFSRNTGTALKQLPIKQLKDIPVPVPTLLEQQKIGSFFKQLDETIDLHQRKLDLLKEQKKGYLQKMFPKNGAKVPELRFAGFADAWEQRELGGIITRLNKTSNSTQLPKVEFEDIISGEGRLNRNVDNKFDDRKGILFQPENILYGKLRPYLKKYLFADFTGVALGDFWVFEAKNGVPSFIYSLIQSNNYQRVANDTAGTKMPRSDWEKVSHTNFFIPKDSKEQQKIGAFFQQLDNTIALHQRKLDLLKEQKKGFLQKMFV